MQKLYTAPDPLQAHVLRGALEAAGIEAEVRRDYIFSIRGESPVTTDTLPEVWILNDEDLEPARAIVQEFERKPNGPVGLWTCQCGEVNEHTFDTCWRCGTPR